MNSLRIRCFRPRTFLARTLAALRREATLPEGEGNLFAPGAAASEIRTVVRAQQVARVMASAQTAVLPKV